MYGNWLHVKFTKSAAGWQKGYSLSAPEQKLREWQQEQYLELHGNESVGAHILELNEGGLLDEALLGGHQQVVLLLKLGHGHQGCNAVCLFDRHHLLQTSLQ